MLERVKLTYWDLGQRYKSDYISKVADIQDRADDRTLFLASIYNGIMSRD